MITLTDHLYRHHRIGMDADFQVACLCGGRFRVAEDHAAHQVATWQEARTVRTVDALDALPAGTVVQEPDADHTWIRHGECWHCSCDGTGVPWSTETLWVDRCDPLIVLWVPEDGAA